MPPHSTLAPRWSTSSLGDPAHASEQDNLALGEHLCLCTTQRGPLHAVGSGLGWLRSQMAGRTVTTFALVGLLAVCAWLVL